MLRYALTIGHRTRGCRDCAGKSTCPSTIFCSARLSHCEKPPPESGIHQQFEIVASGGITVEIDTASGFEHPMQFNHTLGHHGKVGHHIVLAENLSESSHQDANILWCVDCDILIGSLGFDAPMPCIL